MARYREILSKQSKYGCRQGGDELHLEKLMPDTNKCVHAYVFLCVCESVLVHNGSSEDEDVNVLVYVCALQGVCMCVFPRPPKPNTVNSSLLS